MQRAKGQSIFERLGAAVRRELLMDYAREHRDYMLRDFLIPINLFPVITCTSNAAVRAYMSCKAYETTGIDSHQECLLRRYSNH